MNDHVDSKLSGMETLITEDVTKIKPLKTLKVSQGTSTKKTKLIRFLNSPVKTPDH